MEEAVQGREFRQSKDEDARICKSEINPPKMCTNVLAESNVRSTASLDDEGLRAKQGKVDWKEFVMWSHGKPKEDCRVRKSVELCKEALDPPTRDPDEIVLGFRLYRRDRHHQSKIAYFTKESKNILNQAKS
ncbi:unnamed protein product [Protopolystoma xenopodis]|uniref:Uncharacterized protein n=1 Tax=Protopolystoma xenopodis TaxID=117903 RepID=A0A3S5CV16_9PLAT|nr:unnamed protein product [Protopolystoma xenopodis]